MKQLFILKMQKVKRSVFKSKFFSGNEQQLCIHVSTHVWQFSIKCLI